MELPFGTEGRKATHDFLSLHSSSSAHVQQDPAPPPGSLLKTQDFLQPLERVGKNTITDGGTVGVEKAPLPGPDGSVERHLPGGFGTYSISYINQRCIKPAQRSLFATTAQASSTIRNDENSTSNSYPGNGFTLWDESAVQKGKTGKENITITAERHALQEAGVTVVGAQWPSLLNKPSSNHNPINSTITSFSSSQPSTSQKNPSFMDMITSAKNDLDDDEEEDDDDDFIIKKEFSPHPKGNLSVKIEAKTIDKKPNTHRSKHSATEQRRRSKINDRFLKLREVIPNSDQKRDKASFLLEVIEYIQFLQEKVNRYESSYDAWRHDPSKTTHWRNLHITEGFVSQGAKTECGPASVFPGENKGRASSSIPINRQNIIDSDTSVTTGFRERVQQPELASKVTPIHQTIQPNTLTLGRKSSPVSPKQAPDMDRTSSWPPSQFQHKRSLTPDRSGNRTNNKELNIESGNINISSIYSQGLLNALTQALHKSGVDLSRASLSVQIDLGKKSSANSIPHSSPSAAKGDDVPAALPLSQTTTAIIEDFDRTTKRHRTC